MEMIGQPMRVLLLESGGHEMRDAMHALNGVVSAGLPYPALDDCRVRALGGSTHIWGGWLRPLDASDFEERDWVPHSGWPFPRAHLDDYYARAHSLCGL